MTRPRTPRPAALAILAVGALTLSACSGTNADAEAPQSFDGATATVTKGDLVGETTVQGTLHYADSYTLKSAFEGVVTALPTPGTTLTQGSHVYTVAGNNTYLLHGSTPAWRAFEEGMSDGEDVTHLGTVLFAPEDLRIGALKARVGDNATMETELFTASSSRQVISANLKLSDQALGVVGNSVTVRLPGSAATTTGTITSVEPPREKDSEEGSKETTKERIIPITVTPDDTSALDGLQEASVSLGLTSQTRTGVLSVPLGALVALSSDQFGVEVVDEKGEIRRVPVTVGLFAGDRVEVSGDEIAEGQRVVVPNR